MSLESDVFLGAFTAFFDHGLLVVEDMSSEAKHDEWNAGEEAVHLDGDSLYIGVCPSIDDAVKVTVYETGIPLSVVRSDMVVLFSGKLVIPSGYLVISDPDSRMKLTLRRFPATQYVIVGGNEEGIPTEVVIMINQEY